MHTPRDRQGGLTGADGLHRPMHSHQGARASGVNNFAGAAQIQQVGQPVGNHGVGVTCGHLGARVGAKPLHIFIHLHPHKHGGTAAGQGRGPNARIFQGVPGLLQKQPMLGIHLLRFPGRNPEK